MEVATPAERQSAVVPPPERISFKYVVVGKGLIGSAAAKYLAEAGHDVCLVGADEGPGVHGACYDESRIYRILDHNLNWSKLATHSVSEFEQIAKESDQPFFDECGILIMGQRGGMFIRDTMANSTQLDITYTTMNAEGINESFPYFEIPTRENIVGLFMPKKAGVFSARKMLQAQCELARKYGCTFNCEHAAEIEPLKDKGFEIVLNSGRSIFCEKVLVAAGVFSTVLPLLPPPSLKVELVCTQALHIEPDPDTLAELQAARMPPMIYEGPTKEEFMYIVPPRPFPDGRHYLKIGSSSAFNSPLFDAEQLRAWFEAGRCTEDFRAWALRLLKQVFPRMRPVAVRDVVCVTDHTPSEQPYVDELAPGWFVATGGNGWAAKSADALGRVAAELVAGGAGAAAGAARGGGGGGGGEGGGFARRAGLDRAGFAALRHPEEPAPLLAAPCRPPPPTSGRLADWCSVS